MSNSKRFIRTDLFKSYRVNSFVFIFSILLTSFLVIGGCSDNNNNNGVTPPGTTACTLSSSPCANLNMDQGAAVLSCVLSLDTCGVDLSDVITQVSNEFSTVTEDTIMWIEAWGAYGGNTQDGTNGGSGGYAVTTTTVKDIMDNNTTSTNSTSPNTTVIYYFAGMKGPNLPKECGGGGGASTIVTYEDLSLNPASDPTQNHPPSGPILLLAGGGGGGCGPTQDGCIEGGCQNDGQPGGLAFAELGMNGSGSGEISDCFEGQGFFSGCGGNEGTGGSFQCPTACNGAASGGGGYGGIGGNGGNGKDCNETGAIARFINTSNIELTFTAGQGGNGGGDGSDCVVGGGAGGGGWGGGGGGGNGDDGGAGGASGGGGGSFSFASTQTSDLAPKSKQDNPCGEDGCVRINFVAP